MNKQKNFRLPDKTLEQLDQLTAAGYGNQSQVVIKAIDRLWQDHQRAAAREQKQEEEKEMTLQGRFTQLTKTLSKFSNDEAVAALFAELGNIVSYGGTAKDFDRVEGQLYAAIDKINRLHQ